jgi:hypothetical protein
MKKTWYFYFKEKENSKYIYYGEKKCIHPRRTTIYKDLVKLFNNFNIYSICFTDEKKTII